MQDPELSLSVRVAEVRFSQSITINLGNYQATKIDVGVTFPVGPDHNVQETFDLAAQFVEKNLAKQIEESVGENPLPTPSKTPAPRKTRRKIKK